MFKLTKLIQLRPEASAAERAQRYPALVEMTALGAFKTQEAFEVLKLLALRDESYMVQADASRSLGKTKQPQALDVLLDVVDRKSWADVVSVGAIDGMAAMRDDRSVPHVTTRTPGRSEAQL